MDERDAGTDRAGRDVLTREPETPSKEWEQLVTRRQTGASMDGRIVLGRLLGIDGGGVPHVAVGEADPLPSKSVVQLTEESVGCEVALGFEQGDPGKPIVLGIVVQPAPQSPQAQIDSPPDSVEATIDGEVVKLEGEKEIVLRCGKASITLTRAGKVLIRGAFLLSRSSGVNRIKGGSIQLN